MLTVTDVSLQFQGSTLYKHVDLKFAPGNCHGIIGANGAGKSTLLRILSGALEPTTGSVSMVAERRADLCGELHPEICHRYRRGKGSGLLRFHRSCPIHGALL